MAKTTLFEEYLFRKTPLRLFLNFDDSYLSSYKYITYSYGLKLRERFEKAGLIKVGRLKGRTRTCHYTNKGKILAREFAGMLTILKNARENLDVHKD